MKTNNSAAKTQRSRHCGISVSINHPNHINDTNARNRRETEESKCQLTDADIQQEIKQYVEKVKTKLSPEETRKLNVMKKTSHCNDETRNLFKLKLYNFDLGKAVRYYNTDEFCINYCINQNHKNGCKKTKCRFKHSASINLHSAIWGTKERQDYEMAKLLCVYFMFTGDANAQLFNCYGELHRRIGQTRQDETKAEKFYLKALDLDPNNSYFNNNFGVFLSHTSKNEERRAEYYYERALKADPKCANTHYSFAWYLQHKQQKHNLSLQHCDKALGIKSNMAKYHYLKAQVLKSLNRVGDAVEEISVALKQNEKDHSMSKKDVQFAKKLRDDAMEDSTVADKISGNDGDQLQFQSQPDFDMFRNKIVSFILGMDNKNLNSPDVVAFIEGMDNKNLNSSVAFTRLVNFATKLNRQCVGSRAPSSVAMQNNFDDYHNFGGMGGQHMADDLNQSINNDDYYNDVNENQYRQQDYYEQYHHDEYVAPSINTSDVESKDVVLLR